MMKVLRISLLTVCMLAVTIVGFCSPQEKSSEIKDARAYLMEVYDNSSNFKSMHIDMAIDLKNAFGNVSVGGKIDLLNDPDILGKVDMDIAMRGLSGNVTKMTVNQYIKQVGDEIISYSKFDKTWDKKTIPYKKEESLPNTKEVMNYIKSVKIKEQTPQNITMDVRVDMGKVRQAFDKEMKQAIVSTSELSATDSLAFTKVADKVLAATGDITYTIVVNKENKQVVSAYADLSNAAQKAAQVLVKELLVNESASSAEQQDIAQTFTSNISFIVKEDISQYDSVETFVIPEDVINNAKEAKPDKKTQEVKADKSDEQSAVIPQEVESKL